MYQNEGCLPPCSFTESDYSKSCQVGQAGSAGSEITIIILYLRDEALDQYIKEILETLKSLMPTGIPDLGIPPLDPLEVPHFDIPPIE